MTATMRGGGSPTDNFLWGPLIVLMQILVLGMHRSGTSAVARLLNLLGCYVGPEEKLMTANEANPKGFWERLDVVEANDRALELMGGCWYDVADLKPAGNLSEPELGGLNDELRKIVAGLDAHRPWMIKDPRLCLSLPLWLRWLECPVFVLTHRDPAQIARSLRQRDDFPLEVGLALWEAYVLSSLRLSAGYPRLVVHYEELLARPLETVQKLHEFLVEQGISGLRMPGEGEISAFVDVRLQRSRTSEAEAEALPNWTSRVVQLIDRAEGFEDAELPAMSDESRGILQLYGPVRSQLDRKEAELLACSKRRDELLGFESRFHEAEQRLRTHAVVLEQTERRFRQSEHELRELEATHRRLRDSHRELKASHRELEVSHRDLAGLYRDQETSLRDKDRALSELGKKLRESAQLLTSLQQERNELGRAVAELNYIIDAFLRSRSWKVGRWLSWPWRVLRRRVPTGGDRRSVVMERLSHEGDS